MKKLFFTFFVLFFQLNSVYSQTIKSDQIGLISFQKVNDNTSSNLFIGTINESFNLTFDILSGIEYDLYYVIEHCDFDWKKSKLIKSEYLQGFDDVKIDDYYSSFNTYQTYTHYKLSFPNRNTKIKKSGNYILKILDEYGEEIFRRKFILYENLASVQAEIKRSRELEYIHSKQVVNFEINPVNIQFSNPKKTVKVKVFKNNDMNNAIENIQPQYNIGKKLIYKYDSELSFWGENEYLYFENKFVRNTNIRIRSFDLNDIYSSFLYTDFPRKNKKYTYNPDINGCFLVDVSNSSNPEYEADYVNVHFYLESSEINDINSKIYLQGNFNNYEISEKYLMDFNPNTNLHEISISLKQGFYNYKYVSVDINNNIVYGSIGGNFDETENEYNIIVYYRNFGERYDRVVGAGKGLSKYITN